MLATACRSYLTALYQGTGSSRNNRALATAVAAAPLTAFVSHNLLCYRQYRGTPIFTATVACASASCTRQVRSGIRIRHTSVYNSTTLSHTNPPWPLLSSFLAFVVFFVFPGDDEYGYEDSSERWLPVHTVTTILLSVISMFSDPNDQVQQKQRWMWAGAGMYLASAVLEFVVHAKP